MLNGETTCIEVLDMETVKMIKHRLITEFKLNPTSKTKLICNDQELQDNQAVAQFPCHEVSIIAESIVDTHGAVLVDECSRVGWEEVAAAISKCNFPLLLGDAFSQKRS